MPSRKGKESRGRRFFNVDALLEQFARPLPRLGRGRRVLRAVFETLDSFSGVFISLLGYPIFIGLPVLFLLGLVYGPWVFWVGVGLTIGLTGFWVDRKVGRVLRFENYNFGLRLLALVGGFLLSLGLIYLLVYLPRPR